MSLSTAPPGSASAPRNDSAHVHKPSVLIVGGLGYIGRFLTQHILAHDLASTIRIVDKQLPQLAQLAPEHAAAFEAPSSSTFSFVQADAGRSQSLSRVFDLPDGTTFDYIINCGGETRYSQEDEVYKSRSHDLSLTLGREAARRKVRAYLELSTGLVYEPKRDPPRRETDKTKPPLKQARWKLAAEEELRKTPDLRLVVLRLAHVYGPYTAKWLGTQLALARVHQDLARPLKYLWSADLRTNTVHVDDVARACWAALEWRATVAENAVFNIVDQGNTSQATMLPILAELFGIETGYHGTLINTFAKLNLERVVDEVNDDTLDPWAEMQEEAGIEAGGSAPLSPFLEKELLRDHDLSLDGSSFVKTVGFQYKHPKINKQECQAVIESYKRMKWWP